MYVEEIPSGRSAADLRCLLDFYSDIAEPCIICGGQTTDMGLFIPNPGSTYVLGKPSSDGHERVAFYNCCRKCLSRTGPKDWEAALIRQMN